MTIEHVLGFYETKYVFILVFGYVLHIIWGHNKPTKELNKFWKFLKPFLFGCVGAAIRVTEMKLEYIWKGMVLFLISITVRFIVAFLIGFLNRYKLRESLFCAVAWIPKATVQAAIGGLFLD